MLISVAIGHEPVIVQPPRTIPVSNASHPSVVLCANTTELRHRSLRSTRRDSVKACAIVSSNQALSLGRALLHVSFHPVQPLGILGVEQ